MFEPDEFELQQEELRNPVEETEEGHPVFDVNEEHDLEEVFVSDPEAEERQDPKDTQLADQDFDIVHRSDYEIELLYPNLSDNEQEFKEIASTIAGMSQIIKHNNYFITDKFSRQLYCFQERGPDAGIYIDASKPIELAIRQISSDLKIDNQWTKALKRREVYDWINCGLKELEDPDVRHINVMNGLIILAPGGGFISHSPTWSPDYLTTVKLPIYYDENAKCPAWEKFVKDVFPEDSQHIAWEIAALLMVPLKNKAASAIILKGEKNSGKSTFQNGLIHFLGEKNIANLSMEKFGERFQDVQLKGKLANIVGELPKERLNAKAVNVIKQLIGNDMLAGEIKNGANFMFKSYARCLFSCNDMPTCSFDAAFFDRFHIIPFTNQFSKNPENEQQLNETLWSDSELSGLFNKALAALPKVMSEGITATQSMKTTLADVVEDNDSLATWAKEYLDIKEGCYEKNIELHEDYIKKEPTDYNRKSLKAFTRGLKKLMPPEVQVKQKMMDGSRSYYFMGVKLAEKADIESDIGFLEFDLEGMPDIDIK